MTEQEDKWVNQKPTKKQLKEYPDCKRITNQDEDGTIWGYETTTDGGFVHMFPISKRYKKEDEQEEYLVRVNELWEEADDYSKKDDYPSWNQTLNQIWVNFKYRNKLKPYVEKYKEVYDYLSKQVIEKKLLFENSDKDLKTSYLLIYYGALLNKDKWLRDFMTIFNLYLKQKISPSSYPNFE